MKENYPSREQIIDVLKQAFPNATDIRLVDDRTRGFANPRDKALMEGVVSIFFGGRYKDIDYWCEDDTVFIKADGKQMSCVTPEYAINSIKTNPMYMSDKPAGMSDETWVYRVYVVSTLSFLAFKEAKEFRGLPEEEAKKEARKFLSEVFGGNRSQHN